MINRMKFRLLKVASSLLVLIFLQQNIFAADPTINLTVTVNSMAMLSGGWGSNCGNSDCGGIVNEPDPRIQFQAKNSSSGTWLPQTTTNDASWDDTKCNNWFGGLTLTPVGGVPQTRSGIPMNDNLQVQMAGRERDSGLSGGDDGVCDMQNVHSGINNVKITSIPPCVNSDLQESRINCSSGGSTENYGTRWAWKWSWYGPSLTSEHAGQIAFANPGNPTFIRICTPGVVSFASIVNPVDPVPSTPGVWEDVFWQRQREGSGGILLPDEWQTMAFGLTVGDNNLGLGRWHYRRVARYCTGDGALAIKDVISNEIIVEVVPQPVAPIAIKLPNINTVCVGQTITLQGVDYGTGPDAVTGCGFEYQVSTDNGNTWGPIVNTLPTIQAVGNTDPTKSVNIIRVRVKACGDGGCNPSNWREPSWTVDYVTLPSISGNREVCKGQATTLTVSNQVPGATVKWYLDAGLTNEVLPRGTSKAFTVNNNMSVWVVQSRDATGCPSLPTKVDLTVKETTVSAPSSTPVVCLGNGISPNITHTTTGATGIGTPTGLPAGVSAFFSSNTITITGVPTQTGTFTYNIPVTGDCPNAKATGIITVITNNTAGTPSSTPTVCIGNSIPSITHTTVGATGISNAGVSGANGLPAGVSATWSSNTIIITGTPTVDGTFNYTIPLTGGCNGGVATGTIKVNPNANAGTVVAGTTPQCVGQTTTYSVSGAVLGGGTGTWSSSSPSVATINATTGVVTAVSQGTTNIVYTITGGCGGTKTAQAPYTVNSINTVSPASSTPSVCVNTAIPNVTHTTSGATGIGAASGLPAGVSATWSSNTITISGTPTAEGTFNYTIPLTGGCGNVTATGTISVTKANTVSLPSSTPSVCINTAIPNITHTTAGATGIGAATGLPAGISVAWLNNVITISGTPTESGTFNYTIPLTGGCGNVTATGTITVGSVASTPVLSADNMTICSGGSANLTSDVTTVKWYRDVTKTDVLGIGTPINTGNLTTPGNVTFYAENTTGTCAGSLASITINVIAAPSAPTASKFPNKANVCIGTALTLQNPQYGANSGNSCPFEYQYSTDAGNTWSVVQSSIPNIIADGTENIIRIRVAACSGCNASNWTDYSWTIISDTAAPTITGNLSVCTGASTTLVANAPIGSTVRWYSDNGLTTLLNTGTSFSPIITSNTTFYVTQTQEQCVSAATIVDVTALPAPPAPILTLDKSPICAGQNTDLHSSSSTVVWYRDAAKTNRIGVGATINTGVLYTTMTYYAADTSGLLCPSPLSSITVDVLPSPDMGNILDANICSGTSVLLSGGSAATEWFSDDAMTNMISMGATYQTPILTSTTSYYLRVSSSCGVTLDTVVVNVKPIPSAPVASDVEVCSGLTASIALSNVDSAAIVQWFNTPELSNLIHVGSVLITPILTADATYYVTQTVDNCTSPASSFNVIVKPSSNAPILTANPSVICSGDLSVLTSNSDATIWYSDAGQTVIGAGQSVNVNPIATTTYYAQDTAVGCSALASITVKVATTLPTPDIKDVTVCKGADAVLTGGNSGTVWYEADQTTVIGTGATIIVTNVQVDKVYYARNEGSSCTSAFDDVTVTVKNIAAPTASGTSVCKGSTASLSATGQNVVWYRDATLTDAVHSGSVLLTPPLTSDVTYYVTQSVAGCESGATSVTVTVTTPASAPVITASPTSVCAGGTTELTSSAGANTIWYSDAGITVVGNGSPFTTAPLMATATFYARDNSNVNCPGDLSSVQILINASETAPNVSNASVCNGASTELTGGSANTHWYSDAGLSTEVNVGASYTTPTLTSTTTYYLRNENGLCVSGVTEVTVTVNQVPAAPIANSVTPICGSGSVSLSVQGSPNAIITWYADNTLTNALHVGSSYTTPVLSTNSTYYVTQKVNGCESNAAVVNVNVNPVLATPAVTANSPVCEGTPIILSTTSSGNVTYSWAGPSGFILDSEEANPTVTTHATLANQGLYSLVVKDKLTGCVSATGSVQVNVNTAPAAPSASNTGPVCEGGSVILAASIIPGATYEWTGVDGFSATQQTVVLNQVAINQQGTYSVRAFINGCWSAFASTDLGVNSKPTASIPDVKAICEGGTLEITSTTNATDPIYDWEGPNNYIGHASTVNIQDVKANKHQGAYYLKIADGITKCVSDVAVEWVVINEQPTNIAVVNNGPKCEGELVQLSATNIIGADYSWTGPNGFTSQERNPKVASAGDYELTITLGDCLSETVTTTVEVYDSPVANAGNDTTTKTGMPIRLDGSGGLIYAWTPAHLVSIPNIPNPTFIADQEGVYPMLLVVTNEYGCKDQDEVVITVEKSTINKDNISIPDLITPNGDGINDVWNIQALLNYIADNALTYEIGMYARGGSKVMISTSYNNDWDGTYKGKELPDGVYWYAIQLSNGEVFKGSLTIKR